MISGERTLNEHSTETLATLVTMGAEEFQRIATLFAESGRQNPTQVAERFIASLYRGFRSMATVLTLLEPLRYPEQLEQFY